MCAGWRYGVYGPREEVNIDALAQKVAALVLRQVWISNVIRMKSEEESSNPPGVWFAQDVFVVKHTRSREATLYAEGVGTFVTDKLREGNVGGGGGGGG